MLSMRHHGWQRPLHPLQIVGMVVYCFLVVAFYTFLGLFLGSRAGEIVVVTFYTFVAVSVMLLFIRCTAIDPTDKTSFRKKRKAKTKSFVKLNYGLIVSQIVTRFFRRLERRLLKCFIRRKYLDPLKTNVQLEPLLPFPLVFKDDALSPDPKDDDISYCALCDFEVKKHSKHCRTCNRCVEGFDHHCRWLNNCVGKRNYTTFILLMTFVLLMLMIEGGTAVAIFVRCFADKKGIERELERRLHVEFPRWLLAIISVSLIVAFVYLILMLIFGCIFSYSQVLFVMLVQVFMVLLTAYSSAAMGQLFFFHLVLIRKGMRTYEYILAMKETNQSVDTDPFDDSDFSSDSEFDSPEKPKCASRFLCRGHKENKDPAKLSILIDNDPEAANVTKKQGSRIGINPWKLLKFSKEKALLAAEKAREEVLQQKESMRDALKPLPLETRQGPLMNTDKNITNNGAGITPLITKGRIPGSPGRFSSPRRRFSGSPTMFSGIVPSPKQKYRSSFDLKLTEVSKELETYISKQALSSAIKKDQYEASPR